MNLLVESGPWGNLGDVSMAEAVVLQLRELLPKASIHVLVPRGIRSRICENLVRIPPFKVVPFADDLLSQFGFFGRHKALRERLTWTATLTGLDRFLDAGSLSMRFETKDPAAPRRLAQFCEPFAGLHIAGGGNLTDTFVPELFRKCCLMYAFAEQGKPVTLSGQQLGPFRSTLLLHGLEKSLRKARFVGLRDPAGSAMICSKAGLDRGSFAIMGDDSLGLPRADDLAVRTLLEQYGLKENAFLAVNLRFTEYGLTDPGCLEWFATVCDQLFGLFGMPILVVPIHLAGSRSDIVSGREIAKRSSARVSVLSSDELTASLAKGVLSKAFGAVGVSHHFCTFALSEGVPAVCIYQGEYYRQKAEALVACWCDSRLAMSINEFAPQTAASRIASLLGDRSLRAQLVLVSNKAVKTWSDILRRTIAETYHAESMRLRHESHSEIVDAPVR